MQSHIIYRIAKKRVRITGEIFMNTLSIVAPVIIMIFIGYIMKITGMMKDEGVDNIKKYIVNIALPLLIFHAVSVAEYNMQTIIIFGIMMAAMIIALLIGYAAKNMVSEPLRKYFPFMVTAYEGGMLCYPLYQNMCGEGRLSNIVIIDLATCVFVFGIYIGLLQLTDQNIPFNPKQLVVNAFKTPSFIGLIIGLGLGISGLMNRFLALPIGDTYMSIKNMIVAPVSPMILICVGYSLNLKKDMLTDVAKTVAMRFVVQMLLLAGTILIMKQVGINKYMLAAFCVYFLSAPNFNPGNFVKHEEPNKYIATTTSIYCLVTIVGYIVVVMLLF